MNEENTLNSVIRKACESIKSKGVKKSIIQTLKLISDYIEQVRVIGMLFWSGYFYQRFAKVCNQKDRIRRNILVISYYSPPYRSLHGTQRLFKFIKYLSRWGWDITLLTSELPDGEPIDETPEMLPSNLHIVRIPGTRLSSNMARRGKFIPDDFIRWVRPAVNKAIEIMEKKKPEVIFSTAPPYSNMIIATICASKGKGIQHVTDFRDPWTKIDVSWVIKGRLLQWMNKKLECEILRRSNRVIMADDLIYKDAFFCEDAKSYDDKIVSISNGYDEEDFRGIPLAPPNSNKMFSISYVGVFYDQETFNNLLSPLIAWANRHPEDMRQVRLLYAGSSSDFFKRAEKLPFQMVNYGFITHREAISLRYKSNIQLFAQPSYFKSHVYSGKIFEMIRTPVPILAITRKDGAVARLLESTRTGYSLPHGQTEKVAVALKQIFDCWKIGEQIYNPDLSMIKRYSRESLAKKLTEILNEPICLKKPDSGCLINIQS
jgi:glycosyltransferase involved in cell wall biosynthesis